MRKISVWTPALAVLVLVHTLRRALIAKHGCGTDQICRYRGGSVPEFFEPGTAGKSAVPFHPRENRDGRKVCEDWWRARTRRRR